MSVAGRVVLGLVADWVRGSGVRAAGFHRIPELPYMDNVSGFGWVRSSKPSVRMISCKREGDKHRELREGVFGFMAPMFGAFVGVLGKL